MRAAIYARYSTSMQSEASIPDQFRECRKLADRHGFEVIAEFSDAAISGGTANRPGYQSMLEAARNREFDAIIAEDTSRLWRNLAEQAPRLAELQDLGIHVVTHDLDTRADSADILSAVNGAMSQIYRKEIGRRTRRGLEGLARAKKPTGGRSYGYIAANASESGDREIDPEQALIVVRIFEMYADGMSPRAIAEQLNSEGIPSPGSTWNRANRRKAEWAMSSIAGNPKRANGILSNDLYIGRVVWNRFRWERSRVDSSKRTCIQNPESEWIVYDDPRLRIVDQVLWDAVKDRQREQTKRVGERVAQGLQRGRSTGRTPKYLFSTVLKCAACGANYTLRNATHYSCGRYLDGRACSQTVGVKRVDIERGLLAGMKERLLSPEAERAAIQAAHRVFREHEKKDPAVDRKRINELGAEIENLTDAIASGALKASPALGGRLTKAETELEKLETAQNAPAVNITQIVPRLAEQYRAMVEDLENVLPEQGPRDVARARAQIKKFLGGSIIVREAPDEIRLETEENGAIALLQAVGQNVGICGSGCPLRTYDSSSETPVGERVDMQ